MQSMEVDSATRTLKTVYRQAYNGIAELLAVWIAGADRLSCSPLMLVLEKARGRARRAWR